jgi:broad specificity phosphatase PhoE
MAITLLRHAALAQEHQGRYNGWTDLSIDPALFDESKVDLLKHQKFDMVYSSDLIRCQRTLEMMGITEFVTDTRLREVRFKKEIEGLSFKEIEKLPSYKSKYIEKQKTWHKYVCDESKKELKTRIKAFLEELDTSKEILICSHAGTLQRMMKILGHKKNKIAYLENIRIDNVIQ